MRQCGGGSHWWPGCPTVPAAWLPWHHPRACSLEGLPSLSLSCRCGTDKLRACLLPTSPKASATRSRLVARGNCTFYEKVRLAQGSGARGLLIVSKEALVRPLQASWAAWDPGGGTELGFEAGPG